MRHMKNYPFQKVNKGFTLIEILVAVAIFALVMLIAVGAVLSAVDANRKAQSLNSIVNNLSFALESMIRDMRTGKDYTSCGANNACVEFTDRNGVLVIYNFSGSDIIKSVGGNSIGSISGEEVVLERVSFIVEGEGNNDGPQRVLLRISGYAGANKTKSNFNVQTLITSRSLDVDELN